MDAPLTNGALSMQFSDIISYYQQHGLYQSDHDYEFKIQNLQFFTDHPKIKIDTIHDYCTMRSLEGVKNSTINRELTVARASYNFYNKHHDHKIINPFNGFKLFEQDLCLATLLNLNLTNC